MLHNYIHDIDAHISIINFKEIVVSNIQSFSNIMLTFYFCSRRPLPHYYTSSLINNQMKLYYSYDKGDCQVYHDQNTEQNK